MAGIVSMTSPIVVSSSSIIPSSSTAASATPALLLKRRNVIYHSVAIISATALSFSHPGFSWSKPSSDFSELPNGGGVKALDLRLGDGDVPVSGDQVSIHYYGRLAAKQGWRFDSTYDHKDETGIPIPFTFILGSGKVISGIEASVKSMKVGGIRRVVIPPSQGYQNTSQEPIPPNAKAIHYDLQSNKTLQRRRLDTWNSGIRY